MLTPLERDVWDVLAAIIEPGVAEDDRKKTFAMNRNISLPKIPDPPEADDWFIAFQIISGPSSVGTPCYKITGTQPNEVQEVTRQEEMTVNIQAFGFDARTRLRTLRDSLWLEDNIQILRGKGFGILSEEAIIDDPRTLDDISTPRSTIDILFSLTNTVTQPIATIGAVEDPTITVN